MQNDTYPGLDPSAAATAATHAIRLANQGAVYPCSLCLDGKEAQLLGATSALPWYTFVRCRCEECLKKPTLLDEEDGGLDAYKSTCIMSVVQFLVHCRPGINDAPDDLEMDDLDKMAMKYIRLVPEPRLQSPNQPQGMYLGDALAHLGHLLNKESFLGMCVHALNITKAVQSPLDPSHYAVSGKVMSYNKDTGCLQAKTQLTGANGDVEDVHMALMPTHITDAALPPPTDMPTVPMWPMLHAPQGYAYDRNLDAALSLLPNAGRPGPPGGKDHVSGQPAGLTTTASPFAQPAQQQLGPSQATPSPSSWPHPGVPQAAVAAHASPHVTGAGASAAMGHPQAVKATSAQDVVVLEGDEEEHGAEHSPLTIDDTATSAAYHSMQPGLAPGFHAAGGHPPTGLQVMHAAPAQPQNAAAVYYAPHVAAAAFASPQLPAMPLSHYGAPQPFAPPPFMPPQHAIPVPGQTVIPYTQQATPHPAGSMQAISTHMLPTSQQQQQQQVPNGSQTHTWDSCVHHAALDQQSRPWAKALQHGDVPMLLSPDDIGTPTKAARQTVVADGFLLLLQHSGLDAEFKPHFKNCFAVLPWPTRLELYMQLYQCFKGCRLDTLDMHKQRQVDDWLHTVIEKAVPLMNYGSKEHIEAMLASDADMPSEPECH